MGELIVTLSSLVGNSPYNPGALLINMTCVSWQMIQHRREENIHAAPTVTKRLVMLLIKNFLLKLISLEFPAPHENHYKEGKLHPLTLPCFYDFGFPCFQHDAIF